MTPFASRAAAAELARLLDAATPATSPAPATRGDAPHLVALARRLQAMAPALAATAVPRPEFRAALRTRLVAVATVQAAQREQATAPVRAAGLEAALAWTRARRSAGVAVGALASVVVVAGVATAGVQSLPGEPFYAVRTAGEAVHLSVTSGDRAKGTLLLHQASRRLDEVGQLTDAGTPPASLVVHTLAAMDQATRDGRRLLVSASHEGSDPAPLSQLTSFAARQDVRLVALVGALPPAARPRAQQSLALVEDVSDGALTLLLDHLPTAPAAPALPAPALAPPVAPAGPAAPLPVPSGRPAPAPSGSPTGAPPAATPAAATTPAPAPTPDSHPSPSAPRPAPSPTATRTPGVTVPLPALPLPTLPVPLPLPTAVDVPLPVPAPTSVPTSLPSLPVPVPTALPSLPTLPVMAPVAPAVPGTGLHLGAPAPADVTPAPTPAPPALPAPQ